LILEGFTPEKSKLKNVSTKYLIVIGEDSLLL